MSPLSDAEDDDDDDDDEEDKPLAARMTTKTAPDGARTTSKVTTGKRSGKKSSSMKSKAQTAPASMQPPTGREQAEMNGQVNGINGRDTVVKVEERMDESQLNRLATGVTVDAGGTTHAVVRLFLYPSAHHNLISAYSLLSRLRKLQLSSCAKA
jgi:histone acetyltransferase